MNELEQKILNTIYNNRISKTESDNWYKGDLNNIINKPYTIKELYEYIKNLPDIDKASDILFKHIRSYSTIFFCIDIDHDGCTSGVVAKLAIKELFKEYDIKPFFIISSRKYNRGFNIDMLDRIRNILNINKSEKALIVTADMGTGDEENYSIIKKEYPNIDIIVTDHHTVTDNYPKSADALVNVHREDFKLDKCICGCVTLFFLFVMVKYKETSIMYNEEEFINVFKKLLPYACTSTLVDNMSLKYPINRYIIKLGLSIINSDSNDRNFNNFKKALKLPNELSYKDISMSIGPLINTGNRLGFEKLTLYSLIVDDDDKSKEYLNKLLVLSSIRKKIVSRTMETVINNNDVYELDNCVVVLSNTEAYIAGNIANNLTQMLGKPSICFNINNSDKLVGSARSIKGIKLLPLLTKINNDYPELEIKAQGHNSAFGCSINKNGLDKFKKILNKELDGKYDMDSIKINPELHLKHEELNIDTVNIIYKLAPYGLDWEYPIVTTNPMTVKDIIPINNFYKLNFILSTGEIISGLHFFRHQSFSGVNFQNFKDVIRRNQTVKLLFQLQKQYHNNQHSVILEIIDIEPVYE